MWAPAVSSPVIPVTNSSPSLPPVGSELPFSTNSQPRRNKRRVMGAFPLHSSHRPITETTTCAKGGERCESLRRRHRFVSTLEFGGRIGVAGAHQRLGGPYPGDLCRGRGSRGGNSSPHFFHHRRAARRRGPRHRLHTFRFGVPHPICYYPRFALGPFNSCLVLLGAISALRR